MYIHPELARRLAGAKIEEAKSRTPRVLAVRAASSERQSGHVGVRALVRRPYTRMSAARAERLRRRRARLRASGPKTTHG
jgi:hypothetical protein